MVRGAIQNNVTRNQYIRSRRAGRPPDRRGPARAGGRTGAAGFEARIAAAAGAAPGASADKLFLQGAEAMSEITGGRGRSKFGWMSFAVAVCLLVGLVGLLWPSVKAPNERARTTDVAARSGKTSINRRSSSGSGVRWPMRGTNWIGQPTLMIPPRSHPMGASRHRRRMALWLPMERTTHWQSKSQAGPTAPGSMMASKLSFAGEGAGDIAEGRHRRLSQRHPPRSRGCAQYQRIEARVFACCRNGRHKRVLSGAGADGPITTVFMT